MRSLLQLVFILVCALLSAQGMAQVYGGASYGISVPSVIDNEETVPEFEDDAGFRVFAGNRLSEKFAIELAYVDLGSYIVGTIDGLPDTTEQEDTMSIFGYELSFVGRYPFRYDFTGFGRIGVFSWEGERVIILNDGSNLAGTPATIEERDISASLGLDYQFMRNVGAQIETNYYMTGDIANLFYGIGFYVNF